MLLNGLLHHVRDLAAACIVGTCLTACGETTNEFTVFADPGEYEWYSCEQLLPLRKPLEDHENELKLLIHKAKQSTGGAAISVMAYQSDYVTVHEQIKVLDATARIKMQNPERSNAKQFCHQMIAAEATSTTPLRSSLHCWIS